jgi:hypothetical protein
MQQFWVGGDDGCLNWNTFNTLLIPFWLPFSNDHFLFDTFLIQFSLLFIKVKIFPHIPFIRYSCIFLKGTCYFHVLILLQRSNTIAATPHSGYNPSLLLRFWAQSNCCNSKCTLCCCDSRQWLRLQVHSLLLRLRTTIETPRTLPVATTSSTSLLRLWVQSLPT